MSAAQTFGTKKLRLLGAALIGVFSVAALVSGCSGDEFRSCADKQTCPPVAGNGGVGGGAGVAGQLNSAGSGGVLVSSGGTSSGAGGIGGTKDGNAGESGAAGDSGGSGAAGNGGIAGASGTAGAGGQSEPPKPIIVNCSGESCRVEAGGQCCYKYADKSSVCQAPGAKCLNSPDASLNRLWIKCDGTADCGAGQVCCFQSGSAATGPHSSVSCLDAESCNPNVATTTYRQVCDPEKKAPSDCLVGSCKASPIVGLYDCQE